MARKTDKEIKQLRRDCREKIKKYRLDSSPDGGRLYLGYMQANELYGELLRLRKYLRTFTNKKKEG